jgi:hypothetical protein
MGAAEQLPVNVGEPVETRAAKGEIPPSRLLSSNLKLAQANLQKTKHRDGDWVRAALGAPGELLTLHP